MQISHVVCQGANNKMMPFLRELALLSSELSALKSHLRAKLWKNDFIIKVSLKKLLGCLTLPTLCKYFHRNTETKAWL